MVPPAASTGAANIPADLYGSAPGPVQRGPAPAAASPLPSVSTVALIVLVLLIGYFMLSRTRATEKRHTTVA